MDGRIRGFGGERGLANGKVHLGEGFDPLGRCGREGLGPAQQRDGEGSIARVRRRACPRKVQVEQDTPLIFRARGGDQRRALLEAGGGEVDAAELKPLLAGAEEEVGDLRGGQGDLVGDAGEEEELGRRLPDLRLGGAGGGAPGEGGGVGAVDARVPEAGGELPYLEPAGVGERGGDGAEVGEAAAEIGGELLRRGVGGVERLDVGDDLAEVGEEADVRRRLPVLGGELGDLHGGEG